MKFNKNFKVQYKSKKPLFGDFRYLLYRIVPSELPLWKRIFCNRWKYAYSIVYMYKPKEEIRTVDNLLSKLFKYEEAVEFINNHKTYGEVVETLNSLYNKAVEQYNKIMYIDTRWNF